MLIALLSGKYSNRGRGVNISLGLLRAVPVAFLSCQFGEEFLLPNQAYIYNSI